MARDTSQDEYDYLYKGKKKYKKIFIILYKNLNQFFFF